MSKPDLSRFMRVKQSEQGDFAPLAGALGPFTAGVHGAVASPEGEGLNYGLKQLLLTALGGTLGQVIDHKLKTPLPLGMLGGAVGSYAGRQWGRHSDKTRQLTSEGKTAAFSRYGVKESFINNEGEEGVPGDHSYASLMAAVSPYLSQAINTTPLMNKGYDVVDKLRGARSGLSNPDGRKFWSPSERPERSHLNPHILPGIVGALEAPKGESRALHGLGAAGGSWLGSGVGEAAGGVLGGATGTGLGLLGLLLSKKLHMPNSSVGALAPRNLVSGMNAASIPDLPKTLGIAGGVIGRAVGKTEGAMYGTRKGQQAASATSKFMNKGGPNKSEKNSKPKNTEKPRASEKPAEKKKKA